MARACPVFLGPSLVTGNPGWAPKWLKMSDWLQKCVRLAPKCVQLAPNADKSGTFSDLGALRAYWAKMYWNLIWKRPGFVPFGAKLTHFGAKPTICAEWVLICYRYHNYPRCQIVTNWVRLAPNGTNFNVGLFQTCFSRLWLGLDFF